MNPTDSTFTKQQKWEKMPTLHEFQYCYGNDTIMPNHVVSLSV